jgi:enoyl-CoA hydratase/carnithine racemase
VSTGCRPRPVRVKNGVAFVTIDHPPINLLDLALVVDLDRFNTDVRDDDTIRVIVVDSANPEFFLAHGDMHLVTDPKALAGYAAGPGITLYQRYRSLPQITIAKVAGRTRGGGNEFLLTLDMRFAATGRAWFGQPEVSLGILPGSGGTQHLPRLTGRARALEVILGCDVFDAETAERYGWINRALPAEELDGFVDRLASHSLVSGHRCHRSEAGGRGLDTPPGRRTQGRGRTTLATLHQPDGHRTVHRRPDRRRTDPRRRTRPGRAPRPDTHTMIQPPSCRPSAIVPISKSLRWWRRHDVPQHLAPETRIMAQGSDLEVSLVGERPPMQPPSGHA